MQSQQLFTMTNMYEFNKAKHVHTLDGKNLTGVTTVLGVIAKPALIQWAANQAIEFIAKKLLENNTKLIETEWLEEARTAHCKKKEKAGEAGTDVHAQIEQIVKEIIGGKKIDDFMSGNVQVQNFIKWATENKVKFLDSEKHVYSKELWVGGICDLVYEKEGKIYLADVKTSSGIYPENFWQMAAYAFCLKEMGEYQKIEGLNVLNLRKDGKFQSEISYGCEENLEAFKACLTIYRIKEKLAVITKKK